MNILRSTLVLFGIVVSSALFSVVFVCLKLIYLIFKAESFYWSQTRSLYFSWIRLNEILLVNVLGMLIEVNGSDNISGEEGHILVSNHQGFMDILLIQIFCMRNGLDNKFFMKDSLLYLPFIGVGCWGLDFIFIKRFSKKQVKSQPEKISQLHEYIKLKCESYSKRPLTVINFVEGTRANSSKLSKSSYKNLLGPQPMGLSLAISTIKDCRKLIDLSIVYQTQSPNFIELLYGKQKQVKLIFRTYGIDSSLAGNYRTDKNYRKIFNTWIKDIWLQKDLVISEAKR